MGEAQDTAAPPIEITFHKEAFFKSTPELNAGVFCDLMRHRDAPRSFVANIIGQLQRWKLIAPDFDISQLTTYEKAREVMWQAKAKAKLAEPEFSTAFRQEPWEFDKSYEGEYAEDELDKFPRAAELKQQLGNVKFVFRAEPGEFYLRLIVREDGRRQVLREVSTERTIEEINADGRNTPSIIPHFEAVKFEDGRVGLLIDWIDGEMPSTQEEKLTCLTHAEELLHVPVSEYDLWAGNFLIAPDGKPYYIDKDIPEAIAEHGYASATADERRPTFERNKEKMRV